jgi:hypothetical protein
VFQRLGLTPEDDAGASVDDRPVRPRVRNGPAGPAGSNGPRRGQPPPAAAPSAPSSAPPPAPPPRRAEPEAPVQLEDFTQAVVNRVIKTRQRDWQPTQVRRAAVAVDATLSAELVAGPDGAFGDASESVADHLDFLRASGDAWTGRAVALAARRVGLSERAARLAGRLAARLPELHDETQLWACALILRVLDACVRAELAARHPAPRSRGDITEADMAGRLGEARRQILTPTPTPTPSPRRRS